MFFMRLSPAVPLHGFIQTSASQSLKNVFLIFVKFTDHMLLNILFNLITFNALKKSCIFKGNWYVLFCYEIHSGSLTGMKTLSISQ